MPGSPCLSKTGPVVGPSFQFLVNGLEDPWPVSRRCLKPRWFVGDPTSLALDNIYFHYRTLLSFTMSFTISKMKKSVFFCHDSDFISHNRFVQVWHWNGLSSDRQHQIHISHNTMTSHKLHQIHIHRHHWAIPFEILRGVHSNFNQQLF